MASPPCQELTYHKLRDSLVFLNDAYLPMQTIKVSDQFIADYSDTQIKECEVFSWIVYERGLAYQLTREYEKSLTTLYDLILTARLHGYNEVAAESYLTIALVYEFLGQLPECATNLEEALKIIQEHNVEASYPRYCIRYSSYCRFVGKNEEAKRFAQQAIQSGMKIKDLNSELDGNMLMAGFVNNLLESVEFHERAAELFLVRKGYLGAASQMMLAGRTYMRVDKNGIASEYFNKANFLINQASEINKDYLSTKSYLYKTKKELYVKTGNLDSAYYYSEKYGDILPKVFTATNIQELKDSESKFQMELAEQKLQQLEQESNMLQWAIKAGGLVLLILGFLTYFLLKNRNKIKRQNLHISDQNLALKVSKDKSDMLLSEIHHRMKNSLQNIISLIIFKSNSTTSVSEKAMLDDVNSKILSLSTVHQNLYNTGEFDKVKISEYLEMFTQNIRRSESTTDPKITFSSGIDCLNIDTVIPLGILISELISKSKIISKGSFPKLHLDFLKSAKGELLFKMIDVDHKFISRFFIEDDNSKEIAIIRSMCRQLLGTYTITGEKNNVFEFVFKEKVTSQV